MCVRTKKKCLGFFLTIIPILLFFLFVISWLPVRSRVYKHGNLIGCENVFSPNNPIYYNNCAVQGKYTFSSLYIYKLIIIIHDKTFILNIYCIGGKESERDEREWVGIFIGRAPHDFQKYTYLIDVCAEITMVGHDETRCQRGLIPLESCVLKTRV